MKKPLIFAALCGSIAIAGCTTVDPHTGERHPSHAAEGALGGAIVGGIIGALTHSHGNQAENAAIGAGIGALFGGAMGAEQDRREAYWRAHYRHGPIHVRRDGRRIILTMPSDMLFATGSAEIDARGMATVRRMAGFLQRHPREIVTVYGFTDTVGSARSNMELSEARAGSVAAALEEFGVREHQIETRGFGETHLRVRTPDNVDEPRNRRVEVVLEPMMG